MNLRALHSGLIGVALAASYQAFALEVPTDRLIVRLEGGAPALQKSALEREAIAAHLTARSGEMMLPLRVMGDGAQVMQLFRRLSAAEVRSLAARVSGTPGVVEVLPDRIFFPALIPNDTLYDQQWYLTAASGINAPAAWDITTGSPNLIIGIIDTGKLPHTELASRWIGGYDFVSVPARQNDGTNPVTCTTNPSDPDCRDSDASDPGDWVTSPEAASGPLAGCPTTDSRWHGTLMAGVIAASANNGAGIAGLNWNSRLLPVRVVGKCGGYESDIADGMRWAVGISVSDAPANPDTADLLNVSLAAPGPCSSALQSAVNEVLAAGAPIIVAAGNFSLAATGYSPGNCAGVIAVGAVDRNGGKASYTNFGPPIALSAPGGKAAQDFSGGDTQANQWLLTASNAGLTMPDANNSFYANVFGTSIAAAQVAGIASLMLSANPSLAPGMVKDVLRNGTRAFPTNTVSQGSQADCTVALCGQGIADARTSLDIVQAFVGVHRKVDGGTHFSVGLRSDGTLFAWGRNEQGQLGAGAGVQNVPVQLTAISGVVDVSAGGQHTLAVRGDGTLWAWGRNDFGQLGNGTTAGSGVPSMLPASGVFTRVSAGGDSGQHSLALKSDGSVWAWGSNVSGQLGDGTTVNRLTPVPVSGLANVTAIAAAYAYTSYAIKSDGTVWAWGSNSEGALGDGTITDRSTPVQASGLGGVIAIAGGSFYGLALKGDGTVWAWGRNSDGALGNGTTASTATPAAVPGLANVVAIAAGYGHSLALKSDGTVWAWGRNAAGQLGLGLDLNNPANLQRLVPQQVVGITGVAAIGADGEHSLALKPDGSLFAWGSAYVGQLGIGSTPNYSTLPVQVLGTGGSGYLDLGVADPANFVPQTDVPPSSARTSNTIAIAGIAAGTTIGVAGGEYSLGCTATFTSAAASVSGNITVCVRQSASASFSTTTTATLTLSGATSLTKPFSVTTFAGDQTPDAFSFNTQAAVALGTAVTSNAVTITGLTDLAAVTISGGEYSIGCTASFTAAAGTIANNQTACVRQTSAATPDTLTTATLVIGGMSGAFRVITAVAPGYAVTRKVDGGTHFSVGLRSDGTLFAWGRNEQGQLGAGAGVQNVPVQLTAISGVVDVSAGGQHTLAVRGDGTLWAWGRNDFGQLGNGTTAGSGVPSMLPASGVFTRVSAGGDSGQHSLALKSDGSVWAWGSNVSGQLGDGTTVNRLTPVPVSGLANVTAIAAAYAYTSYAIKSDGTVWAWGSNSEGALGDGTITDRSTPVQASGLGGVIAIAGGSFYGLALKGDGTVWAWGRNSDGALGNGTTASTATPAAVPGLANVVAIAAGYGHSLALKSDGTVWAWGRNAAGQLGLGLDLNNPANLQRLVPQQVVGITGVAAIGADGEHSLALKPDGSLFAWGSAYVGQLGIGSTPNYSTLPVQVLGTGGSGYLDLGVADPANFVPQTDVPPSSARTSNTIAIAGIAAGTTIGVAGGEYSLGCTATFTSAAASVSGNITVCVRQSASASFSTTTTATLTLSGATSLTKPFSVTTFAGDQTPDAFSFNTQAAVALGTAVTSNAVTITGLTDLAAVTISGGEYSIGCTASFTAAAGTIANNQTACVRQTSAATPDTLTTATLVIGGMSGAFRVITAVAPGYAVTRKVDGGTHFSVGLRSDGTLFAWGRNEQGQLGAGAGVQNVPVQLTAISGVVDVSAGGQHTLAVRGDGTLWAWGRNDFGQLGNGTTAGSGVPSMLPASGVFTRVSAGGDSGQHSLALKSDGSVWAWGSNVSGQLGDGTTVNRLTPVPVSGLANVTAIAAAYAYTSYAIKSDGTVWAWGSNSEGALGDGTITDRSTPVQASGLGGVIAIAGGSFYGLALKGDGTVWAWGRNSDGALGNGTTASTATPAAVPGLANVVAIAAGYGHSLALKSDGTVWAWGRNAAGQLGLGLDLNNPANLQRLVPQQVVGITGVAAIGADGEHSLALKPDGSLFAWGSAYVGQLGIGSTPNYSTLPVQVLGTGGEDFLSLNLVDTTPTPFAFLPGFNAAPGETVTSNPVTISGISVPSPIAVIGGQYSIGCTASFTTASSTILNGQSVCVRAIASASLSTTSGATLTVGGALGRSATFYLRTRADPGAIRVVPMVAAGDSHTYLLGPDALVYATGYNGNGQLGNGTTLGLSTLRAVAGLADARSIASGAFHGLALRGDGTVAAWGSNSAGQLGHNSANNSERYFVDVSGLPDVASIAAGKYHSVALKGGGTVWAWGLNAEGQVGDGSSVGTRLAPVQVTGLVGVTAIAAGGRHNLALLVDGTVQSWGANESGQLGDGSSTQRNSPVPVSGLSNVVAIAAGDAHSLALKSDGTVVAWGFNAFGQLGDGSTTTRLAPVPVASLGNNVGLIAAGANHSLAVKVGGGLYTWGNNANSQLANGGNTNGLTPTLIAVPSNVVAIAGGARHSAAIDANRRLYLWGDNFFGQVGNRSGNYSPQSAALNVLRGDAVVSTGGGFGGGGASTGGNSGSSVLEVDNQQTGFDFGSRSSGLPSMIQGRFKNQAALEDITGVSVAVNGASFGLVTNTCPATLTPDQECSFTIGFTPSAATNYSGELIVNSSVVGSPERRALFGSGIPPAAAAIAFAKAGLDFAPQLVGQASMATFALNNVGNAALTVTGITSSTTDFTSTHTCTNVPSGAGCQFDVTFVPVAAGARTAILTVTSNASGSPHTVTLSGTGAPTTAAPLDPFADQDADGIPNGVEVAEGRNPNLKDNDIFAIARLFAMQQYRDFLGREGEATGIDFFVDLLNTGAAVRGNVVESFFNSPEFQGSVAPIVRLYFATFLRIPDYPGLIFQTNAFRSGTPLEVIANNFTLSPEFQATYGALDNAQYVALLYQNILSRTPSQGEIDFHVARLVSGVTRGAVLVGFSESPEYQQASAIDVYVTMMYVGMLRRAPEQAGFDFWKAYMQAGNPGLALILGFLNAPEYRNRFLP